MSVERLEMAWRQALETEKILKEWVAKTGHESCWFYADLFNKLCDLYDIDRPNQQLPSRQEFEEGCKKYQDELYGN